MTDRKHGIDEAADNKLLRLLRKGVSPEDTERESPTENRLLALLRQKKEPEGAAAERAPRSVRGKRKTAEMPPTAAEAPAEREKGFSFHVCLGPEHISYLDKMARQDKAFGLIRHMLFSQCLMGTSPLPALGQGLDLFSRSLKTILNKLVVTIRLGKSVVIEKQRYPEVEEAVLLIRGELKNALKSQAAPPPFAVVPGTLPLRVNLTPDDVEFIVKITSQRSPNLVSHLILTQALMVKECPPDFPLEEKLRKELESALKKYALLQKPLLNQVLVKIKLGKEVALEEAGKEQEDAMVHLMAALKRASGILD